MKLRTLDSRMWLPLGIDEVFAFFSDAGNLETLTPASLHFQVLTPKPIAMHAGTLIDYQLRLHLVPFRWQSLISVWDPPHRFVDEQTRGPYKFWKHRHDFETQNGGTAIIDHIEYLPRGWIVAPLINRWFVAPDLRAIFTYRHKKIRELLAPQSDGSADQIGFGSQS